MWREQLFLEGTTHTLTLVAEPREALQWFGSEYSEHQRNTRWWDGTGVLIKKENGEKQPFLFQTDRWNDAEKNWQRPLEGAVVAFTDQRGFEVSPQETPNRTAIADAVISAILASIGNTAECLPSITIKPLKIEPLVLRGIVTSVKMYSA